MTTDTDDQTAAGAFAGTSVRPGPGGGLASAPTATSTVTHYQAARLPDLGDVVLAVSRTFAAATGAATDLQLRAFAAAAPGRGALAAADPEELLASDGAFALATIELAGADDGADERRPATLVRCAVTDAVPTGAAARGLVEWMRSTWETELAFGSWPAVRGSLDAFAVGGGAPAGWAAEWLRESEHVLLNDDTTFLKVLSPAWLDT